MMRVFDALFGVVLARVALGGGGGACARVVRGTAPRSRPDRRTAWRGSSMPPARATRRVRRPGRGADRRRVQPGLAANRDCVAGRLGARLPDLGAGRGVARGHRGAVFDARFSLDGSGFLTAGADGTARVWPAGREGAPLVPGGHPASEAAFSPDGARIFTRGKDDTVRVWTAEDPPRAQRAARARRSRRHRRVDARRHAGRHRRTRRHRAIWPVHAEGALLVISDPGRVLHSADLDRDERRLLTASEDGVLRLWDARRAAAPLAARPHRARSSRPHSARTAPASRAPRSTRPSASGRQTATGAPLVLNGHEK